MGEMGDICNTSNNNLKKLQEERENTHLPPIFYLIKRSQQVLWLQGRGVKLAGHRTQIS